MMKTYYARTSKESDDTCFWQLLATHLNETAQLAEQFCGNTTWRKWAYIAGLWHDIGKYSEEFQKRLAGSGQRVTHSTAGAREATRVFIDYTANEQHIARILGFVITGHHSGLPDGYSSDDNCLESRLLSDKTDYSACPESIREKHSIKIQDIETICTHRPNNSESAFGLSFFIRMLFSCLVDADRLNSEAFTDLGKNTLREKYPSLAELHQKLSIYLSQLSKKDQEKRINQLRAYVLKECIAAAEKPPGVFSLTVPTGGGKTLSSLAFALTHALRHGLKRVIYVIPYTSIIEQNAKVFEECLGKGSVVEHHSNFDAGEEMEDLPRRLATENWDAPLVITTNVQFFQSLFSHHPARCRKLHNIMNSVVILDEAQMLPPGLLMPCVGALRELAERYNTTVLLCTATQPALGKEDGFKRGFERVQEIIPDRTMLYNELKRTVITNLGKTSEPEIASRFITHKQALLIVNTKARAKRFFHAAGGDNETFHLSASMCPAHRSVRIDEIKKRLKSEKPCRVVSTQIVEAGVDIDFPVVYREIAGVDSIVQASGRCNREGKLPYGDVFVFEPEEHVPAIFRQQTQAAQTVMRNYPDMLSLDAIREYFREIYWIRGEDALDSLHIYDQLHRSFGTSIHFPFRTIGESFRLIGDETTPIFIPWGEEGKVFVRRLHDEEPGVNLIRKLQRYTVNIYQGSLTALMDARSVEMVHDRFYVLTNMDLYSEKVGLKTDNPHFRDPENLIA